MSDLKDLSFLNCSDPEELNEKDRDRYLFYWASRTVGERLREVQRLRVAKWGEAANAPIQKVLKVIDLSKYESNG